MASTAAICVLVCLTLVVCAFGYYYWMRVRKPKPKSDKVLVSQPAADPVPPGPGGLPNTAPRANPVHEQAAKAAALPPNQIVVKPMYQPVEVGHRTGQKRVFLTNKGMRVYEVNEFGFPLPSRQGSA